MQQNRLQLLNRIETLYQWLDLFQRCICWFIILLYWVIIWSSSMDRVRGDRTVGTELSLWPVPISYYQMHHNIFQRVYPKLIRWSDLFCPPVTRARPGYPSPTISKIIKSWNKVWSPFKSINLFSRFLIKPFMINHFINRWSTNGILYQKFFQ